MKLLILPTSVSTLAPARLLDIRDIAPHLELVYLQDVRQLTPELLGDCEVIYGCPPPERLAEATHLQWHHLPNAGIEPYGDLRLYANRSLVLTNASGVYGRPIAEHVLAMVLALYRRLPHYVRAQTETSWRRHEDMRELGEARVLVLGMGDLGRNVAALFGALGCHITAVRRNALECPEEADECYPLHRLAELLPRCDVVVNCLPATMETVGLFDAAMLGRMHRDSVFANVGRGNAVDHDALAVLLADGRIWAAALDVTHPEPLPSEHPLWRLDNVIISPHSSGVSPHTNNRNIELFCDLLKRYTEGRRLYNRVDFYAGY